MKYLAYLFIVLLVAFGVASTFRERIRDQREAADALARSLKREDVSVTFVEGKRREEIAAQLDAAGITSYEAFLSATEESEGTLFPDTYRFFKDIPAAEAAKKMQDAFLARTAGLNLTEDEVILASIVEREAITDAERPIIAGVYANRMKIGMRLQADPTTQYGKDTIAYKKNPSPDFVFWGEILRADYQGVNSPFNTYVSDGLPPTPICNPGLKSLAAAANPTEHDYYFFFHRDGQIVLSKTFAEHQRKLGQ